MKKILFLLIILLTIKQFVYTQSRPYWFGPSEKYMLAGDVRIRAEPNLNGEIIGMLPLHAKIKIISRAEQSNAQVIDGVNAYWYLIEYQEITGYIWGGYIAVNTLICDIDNNGIDDFFHYRVSGIFSPNQNSVNAWKDVVIYINNEKISTTDIVSRSRIRKPNHYWGEVYFRLTERNTVLITMRDGEHGYSLTDIFEIDERGKIKHIETIEN